MNAPKKEPAAEPAQVKRRRGRHDPQGLIILYEDKEIIVVDKVPGLLTMGTENEKERTAYWRLTDYERKGNSKSRDRVFIVHRLDRDASGLLVFARTPTSKFYLQEHWHEFEKKYLVMVHGLLRQPEGLLESYLAENTAKRVYSTKNTRTGRLAQTQYRVLQERNGMSLIEVTLLTGRKHQIRVHFSDLGHPITGDKTYGAKDRERRLGLHSYSLAFKHPHSEKLMRLSTDMPPTFARLLK